MSVALGLAEAQFRLGDETSVVALSDSLDCSYISRNLASHLFSVRRVKPGRKFSSLISIRAFIWLFRNRNNFDVFHLHFSRDIFQVVTGLILSTSKAKLIIQPHGMITNRVSAKKWYLPIFDWIFTKRVLNQSSRIIALQEIEMHELQESFRCKNLTIVPNGIRFERKIRMTDRKKLVLFVSRLHPQKNPLLFVEAALNLIDQGTDMQFAIAGADGGLESEILARIEAAETKQLRFLGALENKEVLDLLSEASLLVLPSVDDQFPMIILEALSSGLQVVLSSSSGLAPTIKNNQLGFLFEPKSQKLEKIILTAMERPLNPKTIEAKSKNIFNISSVANTLNDIYINSPKSRRDSSK